MKFVIKIFKILILFFILYVIIVWETKISINCDYVFFVEERLSARLEEAVEAKNLSLLKYIMGQGRACKKERIYNKAIEQIEIIEKEANADE